MFVYERNVLKKTASVVARGARAVGRGAQLLGAQIKDPAVRRAIILGLAAYFLRKAPFLDQGAAEVLSDKTLLIVGLVLSKLPGTAELKKTQAPRIPAPPAAPELATEPGFLEATS